MIQTKLTKLAKRLKIFTFEEFSIMSGEEEKIVKIFLDELLAMERLEKDRHNSYKYNEFVPSPQMKQARIKRMRGTFFSKEEINILESEKIHSNLTKMLRPIYKKWLINIWLS